MRYKDAWSWSPEILTRTEKHSQVVVFVVEGASGTESNNIFFFPQTQ